MINKKRSFRLAAFTNKITRKTRLKHRDFFRHHLIAPSYLKYADGPGNTAKIDSQNIRNLLVFPDHRTVEFHDDHRNGFGRFCKAKEQSVSGCRNLKFPIKGHGGFFS
jgi:hypothetical protein